ncbi:MAG TPA: dihydrofolate reductase family protein [Puia sp.]|jgi:dihydrofolate reductase|nr:dihydrofolate reductase family protein [Puia sp.]
MRKVKLQVQVSVDGFVGGTEGQMDYLVWNWDDKLKDYVTAFTDASDTILMGSILYQGMSGHWSSVPPDNEQYPFAQKMNNYAKIVFSHSLSGALTWNNSRLAKTDAAGEIRALKEQPGKDILVYGGARFVSGLIKENLIDEYHLFVNPVAIGKGLSIFGSLEDALKLDLAAAHAFDCGIVVLEYRPKK